MVWYNIPWLLVKWIILINGVILSQLQVSNFNETQHILYAKIKTQFLFPKIMNVNLNDLTYNV